MSVRKRNAGFSLIEVMVAMTIFAMVMALTMVILKWSVEEAGMDLVQTYTENQVQDAVDSIVKDLKETSPALCTFKNFNDAQGRIQTAICFPTARVRGTDVFKVDNSGTVAGRPVWQGVIVYCIVPNTGQTNGSIYKYVDYTARAYTGPLYVSSVTDTQITVTLPDGTTTAVFSRQNPVVPTANQTAVPLQGRFRQLSAQMSLMTCWNCDTEFIPRPPTFACPTCGQAGAGAIQLTLSSEVQNGVAQLRGTSVITTLTNEALSRNQN
jgi:prepilin-type N-terminal cleavage/methylation domain-containing protein